MELDHYLNRYVQRTREILGDNLVGVYLHGSAVMGCFNPEKSDVDLIIVVKEPVPDTVKRAYLEMVVAASAAGPKKGIEMSVVRAEFCKPFVYPTPYELHFSIGHLDWYQEDPEEYIRELKGTDYDLAAHFTIIGHRGKCLYGPPIEEVFAEVPRADYMDSIWKDIADAEEEITEYPLYLTLNLARVLAFWEEGLVLSKKEGAEWALDRVPTKFAPQLRQVLLEYETGAEETWDAASAQEYAAYMLGRLRGEGEASRESGR